jgi:transposase
MGPSGKRLKSMVETNGAALVEAVKGIPGRVHLCLEEGTQRGARGCTSCSRRMWRSWWWRWLPRTRGRRTICATPWARANELRTGSIRTRAYKAPLHLAALRNAVRGYGFAVRDAVRAMNRLRSVFLSRGVAVNDGIYNAKGRGKWLAKLTPPHRRLAEWMGRQLEQLVPLRDEAEKWLLEEAKTHPIIRTRATAPGMGPIRTAQVVAITANPHRFRTRRQYWSYCGFGIVTRSSSDWVQGKDGRWERSQVHQTRGLTRKRHPLLKAVFKGAATTVITQLPDHPLHKDYERMLAAGIKPNLAKLTLARKIAATVLSMWKHQEVYDLQRHTAVSGKA